MGVVAFGREVRQRRVALGWTLDGLADAAGLTPNFIGGVENGRRNPSLTSMARIAKGLGVHLADLLGMLELSPEAVGSPTVLITALLFGAVHLPDVPLALLCTLAGAFWTVCFLRVPNLLPLALAHGWIGTLTYAWLLGRDPLAFPYP